MKTPLIAKASRVRWSASRMKRACALPREKGVTMILVALAMIAIIAMAALSIDVVTLYLARMETQRSADAAALAAARIISVSGITGDPSNSTGYWSSICGGGSSAATQAAVRAAAQSTIDGVAPSSPTVTYSAGGSSSSTCVGLPAAFGVNPMVSVKITRNNLPTFFSRIWGNTGNTVTATGVAEAFNSSNSGNVGNGSTGTITPVQPRCVKPWLVPNHDPYNPQPVHGNYCDGGGPLCNPFVSTFDGSITNPGISLSGNGTNGVIGETFWLSPDCRHTGGDCNGANMRQNPPAANYNPGNPYVQPPPNLQYVPGQPPASSVAVNSCSAGQDEYQQAIAGCDQSTQYQCGVSLSNTVDLNENPDSDTSQGVQCLINEGSATAGQPDGQDTIVDTSFPFQIQAGSSNPLLGSGTKITASSSIVSVPIYDYGNPIHPSGTSSVTIVGFLQVFINQVDQYGNVNVTVLNVSGCSNGSGQTVGTAVAGSSPVPVRLITPP
jgi:Putative Flp pilus-assembly TadE/G-like